MSAALQSAALSPTGSACVLECMDYAVPGGKQEPHWCCTQVSRAWWR